MYSLLEMVGEGCPGPIHLLSDSAAGIGFRWDPHALAWSRPGLPQLSNFGWPYPALQGCYSRCLA